MLDASGHNQNMLLDFWFSFAILTLVRLFRSVTPLALAVSVLLSMEAGWLWLVHCRCCEPSEMDPRRLYVWLGAASCVSTLWGLRERELALCGSALLLFFLTSSAGIAGLLTGLALNLPLPRKKSPPPQETYGITRLKS